MTWQQPTIDRRTALQTVASGALVGIAGCLDDTGSSESTTTGSQSGGSAFMDVTVDGTTLTVEFESEADVDRINLVDPSGELFEHRSVAVGSQRVEFDLSGPYEPGEYDVVAVEGEESIATSSLPLRPDLSIKDVGLYRNVPSKPWDEVYGESKTDRKKNSEAFVTVENTGTGPEFVTELLFSGDVPNPLEDIQGSGIYDAERVPIAPGERVDLFSDSLPFGAETESGMGCSKAGNAGTFTVRVQTAVSGRSLSKSFDVEYSGAKTLSECEITISES